ncbi:MAG: hypothetical protein E6Q88_14700 [Lysobacteraceae bacterium]|nr:MAG: hypothetical protein E6Q88_14700 [Xanthomonadaceae bacterium]
MPLRIHLYRDFAVCFSDHHQSSMHAHQALQLTVGLDGDYTIELEQEDGTLPTQRTGFACIAPQQKHRIIAQDAHLGYLYVDTNPTAFARWRKAGGAVVAPDDTIVDGLRRILSRPDIDKEAVRAIGQRWCEHSLPGLLSVKPTDPRIRRALEIVDADLIGALNYSELAKQVHLSPSRFAGLFREQTGLPVRNYVLWQRLVYVFDAWSAAIRSRPRRITPAFPIARI